VGQKAELEQEGKIPPQRHREHREKGLLTFYPRFGIIKIENDMNTRQLGWIASSKKDLMEFPITVRKEMGHALFIAQLGGKHKDAKPLKGLKGATILEIVQNDGDGTYRTMYTVQFEEVVYVLHAFQKKSKTGIKTDKQDIDLVKQRFSAAKLKYKEWLSQTEGNDE